MADGIRGRARALTRATRHRAVRTARRTLAVGFQTIVLPLLGAEEDEAARAVACRLAADRGARLLLLAPLFVELELPLDADFAEEERRLGRLLERERALVEPYGIVAKTRIARVRPGELGRAVSQAADEERASLIVVGAEARSQRGFRHPFSHDVESLLREAPSRVLLLAQRPRRGVDAAARAA